MAHLEQAKSTFEPLSTPDDEPNELEVPGACGDSWQRQATDLTSCPSDNDLGVTGDSWQRQPTDLTSCPSDHDFGATGFDRLVTCETGSDHEGPGELDEGVTMQQGIEAGHGETCPSSSLAAAYSPTAEGAADRMAFVLRRSVCFHPWLTPFQDAEDWEVATALPSSFEGGCTDFELLAAMDPTVVHVWEGSGHAFFSTAVQQSAVASEPAFAPPEQAEQ